MNYKTYHIIKEAERKIRTVSFRTLYFLFTPIRKLLNWYDGLDNKFTRYIHKRSKVKEALDRIYTGLKYNNIASFTDDNTISFLKYDLGIDHMSDEIIHEDLIRILTKQGLKVELMNFKEWEKITHISDDIQEYMYERFGADVKFIYVVTELNYTREIF